jgi:Alpha amylase, catalytic domain/Bacterial Alpha amylase C-terminal domain
MPGDPSFPRRPRWTRVAAADPSPSASVASDTLQDVRSLVLYQVFPRNHGPNGTLADVRADLARIADLGVDVVYLMPIHPIGVEGRKGSWGSPYAIRDYRAVNPDLGTDADFDDLVAAAHALGLRVMIDVVFNHTARDSVLVAQRPEFFHQDPEGRPITTVPAWSDIVDLRHPDPELTRYLIDTLAAWVRRGVDGFRCDVASLTPVDFWLQARAEIARIRPSVLWLAETAHPSWVADRRARRLPAWSDGELFAAFDIQYSYDVWSVWQSVVVGHEPVGRYLELLRWQDATLPGNYAKLRYVENHDQYRIMRLAASPTQALSWTALMAFSRGPFMIYAGQEAAATAWPELFEKVPVRWGDLSLAPFLRTLAHLKKHPAVRSGEFWILADEPHVQAAWAAPAGDRVSPVGESGLYGIFDVSARGAAAQVQLPDGDYRDLLSGVSVRVSGGAAELPGPAAVLEFSEPFSPVLWRTPLLDVFLAVEELGDTLRTEEQR